MSVDHDAMHEIRQLKARYFRYLDGKDYEGLAEVFADKATIDVRGSTTADDSEASVEGLDDGVMTGQQFKQFFRSGAIAHIVTAHHGHMPEITVESPTTARAIWPFEDHIWFPEGSPHKKLQGWGHYHDEYEKIDGRWQVTAMKITRLKIEMTDW